MRQIREWKKNEEKFSVLYKERNTLEKENGKIFTDPFLSII